MTKFPSWAIFREASTKTRRKNILFLKNMAANVKISYDVPKETNFKKQRSSNVKCLIKWHPAEIKKWREKQNSFHSYISFTFSQKGYKKKSVGKSRRRSWVWKWCRSSRPDVFCGKGVLKKLAKVTGTHLCWSLFLFSFFNRTPPVPATDGAVKRLFVTRVAAEMCSWK